MQNGAVCRNLDVRIVKLYLAACFPANPMEALVTMLSTTDLEFSLDEPGTIVVSTRN